MLSIAHYRLPFNTRYFRMDLQSMLRDLRERRHPRRHWMFPGITLFAVLREVEPLDLMVFRNAQPDQDINELEDHQSADNRQTSSDRDANRLIYELVAVALQSA